MYWLFVMILNIYNLLNLMIPVNSYEPEEICLIFEREEPPPKKKGILMNIAAPDSVYQRISTIVEVSSSHLQKCGILCCRFFFARRKITDGRLFVCLFIFVYFSQGLACRTNGPISSG